ncbi:hypothetical protein AVEN_180609-1 [Araneus ventricosus]|uniref:Retrovirus-related Pol polyprotein from transposon TNT 1-94 n=1 Tax=Araneus ventricosus TaxID=182803 RepID=A0A4Y2MSB9_ARAVE|nr:hypothetical protein AVEN_180609-1 [Araneus ventricosus]
MTDLFAGWGFELFNPDLDIYGFDFTPKEMEPFRIRYVNEIDHKTKVPHSKISAEPAANENNYSIPFETQTPDVATNTVGEESETPDDQLNYNVVNQMPVRRSERLKTKQMSTNLACNVPNSFLEAKNSADWQNWEFAMKNELDSLNKHEVWEIVDNPAKTKLVNSKVMIGKQNISRFSFVPRSLFITRDTLLFLEVTLSSLLFV